MYRRSLYIAMPSKNKESSLILRIDPDIRTEFKAACRLRGASMSGLIHQFIFRTIREEKDRNESEFKDAVLQVISEDSKNQNGNAPPLPLIESEANYLVSHGTHKVPSKLSKNAKKDIEEGLAEAKEIARRKKAEK